MLSTNIKLPWEKLDAWAFFFFFYECLGIQFLIHTHVTYGTPCHARGHFAFYYHHVTYRTPCHASGHLVIFTVSATDLRECFLLSDVFYLTLLIPREAEDFPRVDRHFKHVPLPTYLICLSPKELYTVGSI